MFILMLQFKSVWKTRSATYKFLHFNFDFKINVKFQTDEYTNRLKFGFTMNSFIQ